MSMVLSIDSSEALGDLCAWADEPAHCNDNPAVATWLRSLTPASFPFTQDVPAELALDVEELCGDWEEVLNAQGEGVGFSCVQVPRRERRSPAQRT